MATEKDKKFPVAPTPAKPDPKKFEPHHQQNHPTLKDESKMFPKAPGAPEVKTSPAANGPAENKKTT